MRYVNIETGAVVDSPFKLSGENWILEDNNEQEEAEQVDQEEEYVEEDAFAKKVFNII